MHRPAGTAHRAQEQRVDTFHDEGAVERGEGEQRHRGDPAEEHERRIVEGQDRPEQDVQEIDLRSAQRDEQHAGRQGDQVEGGETRIFLDRGRPG